MTELVRVRSVTKRSFVSASCVTLRRSCVRQGLSLPSRPSRDSMLAIRTKNMCPSETHLKACTPPALIVVPAESLSSAVIVASELRDSSGALPQTGHAERIYTKKAISLALAFICRSRAKPPRPLRGLSTCGSRSVTPVTMREGRWWTYRALRLNPDCSSDECGEASRMESKMQSYQRALLCF